MTEDICVSKQDDRWHLFHRSWCFQGDRPDYTHISYIDERTAIEMVNNNAALDLFGHVRDLTKNKTVKKIKVKKKGTTMKKKKVKKNDSDWLYKSMKQVQKEVEGWPDWMKRAMGIEIKKKTKSKKK